MLKRLMFLCVLAIFLHPSPLRAAGYQNLLGSLDVAGVKLGIDPLSAEKALTSFNNSFTITKMYIGSTDHRYPKIESKLEADVTGPGILYGLKAVKQDETSYELVHVYFNPSQEQGNNKEEVVAIFRWKTYLTDFPQAETIMGSIQSKIGVGPTYSKESELFNMNSGVRNTAKSMTWVFTSRGKIEASTTNIKNLPSPIGYMIWEPKNNYDVESMMPKRITNDTPANMQLELCLATNKLLVKGFSQLLVDEDKLLFSLKNGKQFVKFDKDSNVQKKNTQESQNSNRKEKF